METYLGDGVTRKWRGNSKLRKMRQKGKKSGHGEESYDRESCILYLGDGFGGDIRSTNRVEITRRSFEKEF